MELKGGVELEIIHQTNIGFIYDVCQVVICKTAKRESWISPYTMDGREESDMELLDKALNNFEDVDPAWSIITLLHPKKGRILSKLYIDFMKEAKEDWRNMDFVNYISTPELLKSKICDWYFDTTDISELDCFSMLHRNGDLDHNIKLYLYEFFAAPTEYVSILQQSLQKVVYDRLMGISAGGSNRDGCAIRYVCETLLKRSEEIKLFFIASDGQPNDGNYYGEEAENDLRSIKQEYQRKGIIFVAAAIGDDREKIQSIYGDSFCDISDLKKLPVVLTNLIKRHIRV